MGEPRFTKGPWDWDAGDIGEEISVPYCTVFTDSGELVIAYVNDSFDREQGRINARLIAAAPALYAALSDLVGLVGNIFVGPWSIELDKARAALSLANPSPTDSEI